MGSSNVFSGEQAAKLPRNLLGLDRYASSRTAKMSSLRRSTIHVLVAASPLVRAQAYAARRRRRFAGNGVGLALEPLQSSGHFPATWGRLPTCSALSQYSGANKGTLVRRGTGLGYVTPKPSTGYWPCEALQLWVVCSASHVCGATLRMRKPLGSTSGSQSVPAAMTNNMRGAAVNGVSGGSWPKDLFIHAIDKLRISIRLHLNRLGAQSSSRVS